jgi:hypothetical protein
MPTKTITEIRAANNLGDAQVGDILVGNRGVGNTGGLAYAPKLNMDSSPSLAGNLSVNGYNVVDVNGSPLFVFNSIASAVNWLAIYNNSTGNGPIVAADGNDAAVDLQLYSKTTGQISCFSTNSTPIVFHSGTAYQHATNFTFANTGVTRTVTFPDATGTVAFDTNQTLINPTIKDSNSNNALTFTATASAVNYFTMVNSATTISPVLTVSGTDTNANITIQGKGTGIPLLNTTNTTQGFVVVNGTAYQHTTSFNFANTANSRTVTFPDASGTLYFDNGAANQMYIANGTPNGGTWTTVTGSGAPVLGTSPTISTPVINGFTNASSAAAGVVGETLQSSFVTTAGLTNGVAANITSLALTAGDWDVWAEVNTNPAIGTTTARVVSSVNTVSATLTSPPASIAQSGTIDVGPTGAAGVPITIGVPSQVIKISGTTTYYLNVLVNFAASTLTASGVITARRRR